MASFILIHGAMHGGWCWDRVTPLLEKRGHQVIAPDLPGMGNDHSVALADVSLAHWARFVVSLADAAVEPPILVGHSRGGLVIGEAAELSPERLAGLVYLSGAIVMRGQTLGETMAAINGAALPAVNDGISISVEPLAASPYFYHRCDPAAASWAAARLCAEPLAPLVTPSSVTPERWGQVPRGYIECLDDRAISLDAQRMMQRRATCDPVIEIDADHSPFLSAPEETAKALEAMATAFAAKTASPGPSR